MAGDFNKPATSDAYTAFASSVRDIAADLAKGLDPAVVSTTNIPTDAIRWTSAANKWQKWNGAAWVDLSSLYAINISGNAATATNATNAAAVPWSGVSSKPTTVAGYGITDLVSSILASFRKDNWFTNGVIAKVSGLLAWKNYGNNHVIFDASAGTAPDGTAVSNTNAGSGWAVTYPVLMGWNGTSTFGVRVDSARVADSASSATTAGSCSGNAATATYATSAGSATTAGSCSGNAATATSAGNADTVDGYHATGLFAYLGISRTWQDVKASRASGTTYNNGNTYPIEVSATGIAGGGPAALQMSATVAGVNIAQQTNYANTAGYTNHIYFTVPPGANYSVTTNGTFSIWAELR